jgi:ubiquinone biosynthesis protein
MAEDGLRLDEESVARIAHAQSSQDRWTRLGIWVGALALLAIAVAQIF